MKISELSEKAKFECSICHILLTLKYTKTKEEFVLFLSEYAQRILNMPIRTEGSKEIVESGAERRSEETIISQESETSL
jgi:hypothetical protein